MLFSIFCIIALLIQALIASKKQLWTPDAYTILPTALFAILTRPLSPLRRYRSAWWCFRWGNMGKSLIARSELWGGWSMTSPKESVKSWIRAEECVFWRCHVGAGLLLSICLLSNAKQTLWHVLLLHDNDRTHTSAQTQDLWQTPLDGM